LPSGHFEGQTLELTDKLEQRLNFHLGYRPRSSRQITDMRLEFFTHWRSVKSNAPAVGYRNVHNHANGCGFAGAIGSQKTKNSATLHAKRNIINRPLVVELFDNILNTDKGHKSSIH
jgi:hypothetical protein